MQAMRAGLALSDLSAILVTHGHGDHCYGLFSMLSSLAIDGREAPLAIVAAPEVRAMVESVFKAGRESLPYELAWELPEHGKTIALSDGSSARCVEMRHRCESHGYLIESDKIKTNADPEAFKKAGFAEGKELGAAIAEAKRGELCALPGGAWVDMSAALSSARVSESLFVGGDNVEPMRVAKMAYGALAWVHEATYAHADWERAGAGIKWGHSSARMIGEAAKEGQPGVLVLTHFSARYGEGATGIDRLADEARAAFGGQVILARDLEAIAVAPRIERLGYGAPGRSGAKASP